MRLLILVSCVVALALAAPKSKRDILPGDPRYGTDYHHNHHHHESQASDSDSHSARHQGFAQYGPPHQPVKTFTPVESPVETFETVQAAPVQPVRHVQPNHGYIPPTQEKIQPTVQPNNGYVPPAPQNNVAQAVQAPVRVVPQPASVTKSYVPPRPARPNLPAPPQRNYVPAAPVRQTPSYVAPQPARVNLPAPQIPQIRYVPQVQTQTPAYVPPVRIVPQPIPQVHHTYGPPQAQPIPQVHHTYGPPQVASTYESTPVQMYSPAPVAQQPLHQAPLKVETVEEKVVEQALPAVKDSYGSPLRHEADEAEVSHESSLPKAAPAESFQLPATKYGSPVQAQKIQMPEPVRINQEYTQQVESEQYVHQQQLQVSQQYVHEQQPQVSEQYVHQQQLQVSSPVFHSSSPVSQVSEPAHFEAPVQSVEYEFPTQTYRLPAQQTYNSVKSSGGYHYRQPVAPNGGYSYQQPIASNGGYVY